MTTPALSPTISDAPAPWPAADWNALRAAGLAYVERFGHQFWTDYNRHDPGITTLELLCYALTDLSQRTAAAVPDVLRTAFDAAYAQAGQTDKTLLDNSLLLPAHEAFPTSPVTLLDYRKLLLDVPGVRNAWLVRNTLEGRVFVNTMARDPATDPDLVRKPNGDLSGNLKNYTYIPPWEDGTPPLYAIQGLYDILVDLDPAVATGEDQKEAILRNVRAAYLGNRNLGEDLVKVDALPAVRIGVQARLELGPDADPATVHAQLLLAIDQHLAPVMKRYSLAEMQALTDADGQPLSLDQIFEGPRLTRGFIREADLRQSELRTSIHASDLIALALEIPGVRAISGLKMSGVPTDATHDMDTTQNYSVSGDADHWTLEILQPCRLELELDAPTALQFTRNGRELGTLSTQTAALRLFQQLKQELQAATVRSVPELPVRLGTALDLRSYAPLALDFPATYGIGPAGLPADAPAERRYQARQLQAYLLFFDQLLANYLAQLVNVRRLLTTAPDTGNTYFGQVLDDTLLPELRDLFASPSSLTELSVAVTTGAPSAADTDRHNRFQDHLLARFGESFAEYGLLVYNTQALPPASLLEHKQGLAQDVPKYQPARGFDYTLPSWIGDADSANEYGGVSFAGGKQSKSFRNDKVARNNVSSIARRFGRLLGMPEADFTAHASLRPTDPFRIQIYSRKEWRSQVTKYPNKETIVVVEHTLLRPPADNTTEWLEAGVSHRTPGELLDPYSYRLTILLPAQAPRFADPVFRRHAEALLRAELPAHVLPHICWISAAHLAEFEVTYNAWLYYKRLPTLAEGQMLDRQTFYTAVVSLLNEFHSAYLPQEFPGPAGYGISFLRPDPLNAVKGFETNSFL